MKKINNVELKFKIIDFLIQQYSLANMSEEESLSFNCDLGITLISGTLAFFEEEFIGKELDEIVIAIKKLTEASLKLRKNEK
jgi:hypothetical protein